MNFQLKMLFDHLHKRILKINLKMQPILTYPHTILLPLAYVIDEFLSKLKIALHLKSKYNNKNTHLQEMKIDLPPDYADREVIEKYVKDFRVPIPIHAYDSTIAKKVNIKEKHHNLNGIRDKKNRFEL